MSKKVDERVVEMRFDNKDFESNVKTTMSTLDRLKAALKLPTSSKSLDGVANAAKNSTSNIAGLGAAVETVNARFSALQVVGMTALSNITTAAMRAGSNLVKQFTIEPIVSGFREYETQLNSVQTILANTQSKGTTLEDVTAALDELNAYADQTIYNFTEMTRNIGTFTAAGVDLDASVSAIKGIANLAAVSGSTSQQASTAMYQLSQALATGRVSLMDWNSVVNAGMGGEVFQNALKRTAEVMGTNVDAMIEKYGSFRESLTQGGWLTADVLTKTLEQFTMAAEEGSAEWDKFKASLMEEGYTEAQATEILRMANTATDAATKVKTFTQLMDTLSEAAGSGWAKTWQLIFGDFEEAKAFWTELSDMFSGMINASSDARNAVIEGAMNMGGSGGWDELKTKIEDAGVSMDTFQSKLSEVVAEQGGSLDKLIEQYGSLGKAITSGAVSGDQIIETLKRIATSTGDAGEGTEDLNKKLEYFQDVVDRVWQGEFKNAPERYQLLADAGYDYAAVQDLVNKTVDGHRLTLEDLSDAQLASIGYTKEEITQIRALADEAAKAGTPLNELINNLSKKSGRELFLESLTNLLQAIIRPLSAVKDAFDSVFSINSEELYGIIEAFHSFTETLLMDSDTVDNLTRTLKGLFAVIHLVATAAGNTFTVAFNIVNSVLGLFGTNLLEVTAILGDALFSLDKWITSGDLLSSAISGIGSAFSWLIGPIGEFLTKISELPAIANGVQILKDAFNSLKDTIHSLAVSPKNFFENLSWEGVLSSLSNFGSKIREAFSSIWSGLSTIGPDIIAGLQNGLSSGWESVIGFLTDLANKIVEAVKAVLGIQSPSTVFFEIGKNIIEGLVNGIKFISSKVAETLKAIVGDLGSVLSEIDWGTILTVAGAAGVFVIFYKIADAFQSFGDAIGSFAGVGEKLQDLVGSFDKLVDAKALQLKAEAVKSLAIGVGILAASVFVLAQLDPAKLWSAVGALTVMGGVLAGLVYVMGQFGKSANKGGGIKESLTQLLDIGKVATLLVSLGASLLMLSAAMVIIGGMDEGQVKQAGIVIAAFGGLVAGLIAITKISGTKNLDKAATYVKRVSVALLLMSVTARILGGMSSSEMISAGIMLAAFGGLIAGLIAITKFAGNKINSAANFISKVGVAFLALSAAAKIMGGMSSGEMISAGIMLAVFTGVVSALIAITTFAGDKIDQASDFLLKVSGAFVLLGVAAKILGGMSTGEMIKAGVAIAAFTGVMAALVAITKLGPKGEMAKISTTLLAMSASIAILAGVAVLLGMIELGNLVKGLAAVTWLAALVAMMVKATSGAKDVKGTMIGIAAAIGVMAASIAVLSLLDPVRVAIATACMSAVMFMFGQVVKMGSNVQTSMGVMIIMVAALGVMAAAIGILAQMPWQNTLAAAGSLSVLLLAMSGAMVILSTIGDKSKSMIKTVGVMAVLGLVMAELGLVLAMMTALNVQDAIPNAIALSTLLLAMSAAMIPLSLLGSFASSAIASVGVMAALGLVMAELGLVLAMMTALNVQDAIPNAIALSTLLLTMSGVMVVLSILGPMAVGAIAAAGSMAAVIGIIAGIVAAAGAIAQIPGADWLVSEGAAFLQKIGEAIGGFVGGIIAGGLEAASSTLPQVGTNLSLFMMNLTPFIMGAKMITPEMAQSISDLAGALLVLTAGSLLDQLTSWITGGNSLAEFGAQLAPFGEAMAQFANSLSGVDMTALSKGAEAGKSLADLANNLPKKDGWAQTIFGSNTDLGTFGEQLGAFGDGMKTYASKVTGLDVDAIQASIPAAQALSDLAKQLPEAESWKSTIFGQSQGLDDFGGQLESFGDGLSKYANKVTGLDVESITASIPAAQALSDLAKQMPDAESWASTIFGGKANLADFGSDLEDFGEGLSKYSEKVGGLNTEKISSSTTQIRDILNVLRSYANADDIDTGITNGKKISDLGDALKTYSEKIAAVDPTKVASSATAVSNLKDAINSLVGLDSSGIANFQAAINQLAQTNVQGLIDTFSNIDMSSIGANMMTSLAAGISVGGAIVVVAATSIAMKMSTAIKDASSKIVPVGLETMTKFASGIISGKSKVVSATTSVLSSASSSIRGYYGRFYSAGSYIAQGLASGMRSQLSSIRSAAAQMSNLAAQAARAAAQVHSPSRVFYKIGGYMGQGLVNALDDYGRVSYKAGKSLGESSIDGLSQSISKIGSALDSEMNVNPTIRPVMDLSDVKNGADQINGMLNNVDSLGISHATSIDRMMNSRIQNGSFSDVVSAVDRLRGALDNVGNTTYQVNGVTYDDGSAIAGAVSELIRATRIERRI